MFRRRSFESATIPRNKRRGNFRVSTCGKYNVWRISRIPHVIIMVGNTYRVPSAYRHPADCSITLTHLILTIALGGMCYHDSEVQMRELKHRK